MQKNKTECKMTLRNEEPHVNKCFPRVRGDVPLIDRTNHHLFQFSPRARGCSLVLLSKSVLAAVFPACAGMFPPTRVWMFCLVSFPRVRGDVPWLELCGVHTVKFSPRARGCSEPWRGDRCTHDVFPACAGMFPPAPVLRFSQPSFSPRARGCSGDGAAAQF